jgi:hypothetical protein
MGSAAATHRALHGSLPCTVGFFVLISSLHCPPLTRTRLSERHIRNSAARLRSFSVHYHRIQDTGVR